MVADWSLPYAPKVDSKWSAGCQIEGLIPASYYSQAFDPAEMGASGQPPLAVVRAHLISSSSIRWHD